jgi:uncharacterized protein (TIGR00369 family)
VADDKVRSNVIRGFTMGIPHNLALGIECTDVGESRSTFVLHYDPKLVGNPDTGTIHGGAITALLDGASGAAVFAAITEWRPIATIDLRIDYLRAAEPPRDVIARAHCYKVTRNVAFVRAVAFHDDEHDPIASSAATFMLGTKAGHRETP